MNAWQREIDKLVAEHGRFAALGGAVTFEASRELRGQGLGTK